MAPPAPVEFKPGVPDYSSVHEPLGELFDPITVSKIKIVFPNVGTEIYSLFIKWQINLEFSEAAIEVSVYYWKFDMVYTVILKYALKLPLRIIYIYACQHPSY